MQKKTIIALGLLMAMFLVVAFFGISGIIEVNKAWMHSKNVGIQIAKEAKEFYKELLQSRHASKDFLLFYKRDGTAKTREMFIEKEFARHINNAKSILKTMKEIEFKDQDAEGVRRIEEMEGLLEDYNARVGEFASFVATTVASGVTMDQIRAEAAIQEKYDSLRGLGRSLEEAADKEEVEGDRMSEEDIGRALSVQKKYSTAMAVVTVSAIILSIVVAVMLVRVIRKTIILLTDTSGKIGSTSSEILAATQQQAAGAREQSAAVSETTAASKELSKSAEQVGESIKRVLESATHALSGMTKIKGTISKTGQIVTSLNEKSQKIGKITDVIDDVADQTNLLAVNAAIEAARAGEQGRGFTVVADEIRKLADSTAKSTKDITALIEVIQHEMSNAIMSMETSMVGVDEESKLAQESAERSEEIAMSATQQISGSKQIAEAMANIDETMKQIAVSAQQSQVAVKQLTELGKDLKDMIKRLA